MYQSVEGKGKRMSRIDRLRLQIENPAVVVVYRVLASWLNRSRLLLLTTTGRRSNRTRTVPLVYMSVGSGLLVTAANLGADTQPAWYLNVRNNPRAEVQIGKRRVTVLAREVYAAQREHLCGAWIERNPGYRQFQSRTGRRFPMLILEQAQAGT